jgi:hypothetical protein
MSCQRTTGMDEAQQRRSALSWRLLPPPMREREDGSRIRVARSGLRPRVVASASARPLASRPAPRLPRAAGAQRARFGEGLLPRAHDPVDGACGRVIAAGARPLSAGGRRASPLRPVLHGGDDPLLGPAPSRAGGRRVESRAAKGVRERAEAPGHQRRAWPAPGLGAIALSALVTSRCVCGRPVGDRGWSTCERVPVTHGGEDVLLGPCPASAPRAVGAVGGRVPAPLGSARLPATRAAGSTVVLAPPPLTIAVGIRVIDLGGGYRETEAAGDLAERQPLRIAQVRDLSHSLGPCSALRCGPAAG